MQLDRQLLEEDRLGFLAKEKARHSLWFFSTKCSCLGVRCLDPVEGSHTVGEQFASLFQTAVLRRDESSLENSVSFHGLWRELRQLIQTNSLTLDS